VEQEFGFPPARSFVYLKSRSSGGMLLSGDNANNQNALQDLLTVKQRSVGRESSRSPRHPAPRHPQSPHSTPFQPLKAFTLINTTMAAGITFNDRCVRYSSGGPCDTTSLLPIFNYSATAISNNPDVLGTINAALAAGFRNDIGRLVDVDNLMGDVQTDGMGNVRSRHATVTPRASPSSWNCVTHPAPPPTSR
jgi:hypothetical protein